MLIGKLIHPSMGEIVYGGWNVIHRCVISSSKASMLHYRCPWFSKFAESNQRCHGGKYGPEYPGQFLDRQLFQKLPLGPNMDLVESSAIRDQQAKEERCHTRRRDKRALKNALLWTKDSPTSLTSDVGPVSPLSRTQHDNWRHWVVNELSVIGTKFENFDGGSSDCVVRKIINACS